uniref:Zinc finger protein 726 n=1 Tax=Culex pipiens TaxID=7175 RepID=A0A8D8PH55_CULPI
MEAAESAVCRLCLQPTTIDTMTVLNQNEHLVKSILEITSIEAIVAADLFVYMCNACQLMLDQCIQFRTSCVGNDSIFRKTYAKYIPVEDQEYLEIHSSQVYVKLEPDHEDAGLDPVKEEEEEDGDDEDADRDYDGGGNNAVSDDSSDAEPIKMKRGRPRKNHTNKDKELIKAQKKDCRKVQCQQCGKMVVSYNLTQHLLTHNPDRPKHTCPYCPKSCYEPRRLKLHINSAHTREIQYTCDQCGKTYGRPSSLRAHYLAEHTDIKRYECKECGEKFARSTMRNHHYKVVHMTGRPWACEYCDKTFKIKSDWTIHTRIHTGEKPFKCDICGKTFNKSYNVVIHKKSHRNDEMRAAAAAAAAAAASATAPAMPTAPVVLQTPIPQL